MQTIGCTAVFIPTYLNFKPPRQVAVRVRADSQGPPHQRDAATKAVEDQAERGRQLLFQTQMHQYLTQCLLLLHI